MILCPECSSPDIKKNGIRNGHQRCKCNTCNKFFQTDVEGDIDLIVSNVQLAKQSQKFRDINRVRDKAFREHARVENALSEFNEELIKLLREVKIDVPKRKKSKVKIENAGAVIQLADLHLNELIAELFNKYDFSIASQRLKLYATQLKVYLKSFGVKQVVLANTGDTLNSDRRLDEFMNMANNRAKATLLSVYLLEQFIIDLLEDFELTCIMVTGNESRAKEETGNTDIVASDNYDFTIHEMLKMIFRKTKGIDFPSGDYVERYINIAGQNVLFVHGNQMPNANGVEKAVQQLVGKYAHRGIIIDYVIIGHFHSARIGDIYSRSSSLSGGNTYSDKELQLSSRASQNVYLFWNNGNRDAIKIDLQKVDGVEGYDIKRELEAYNTKSAERTHHKETIIQIVI